MKTKIDKEIDKKTREIADLRTRKQFEKIKDSSLCYELVKRGYTISLNKDIKIKLDK